MYTLDTNAIIYYLKDDFRAVPILRDIFNQDISIYISTVTELELFSFSNLTQQEAEQINDILETLAIIPLDSRIARTAGLLRQFYGLKTADSAIAATALFTNSILLTRNVKDFQNVSNLEVKQI